MNTQFENRTETEQFLNRSLPGYFQRGIASSRRAPTALGMTWVVGVCLAAAVSGCSSAPDGSTATGEPTATGTAAQAILCCSSDLLSVTEGTPDATGGWITVNGNAILGDAGDTYWIGICSNASSFCDTGTWLWSETVTLSNRSGGEKKGHGYFPAGGDSLIAYQCPASWGYLWGYNTTRGGYDQCGINLPGGSANSCNNGFSCIEGCCTSNAGDICTADEYPDFYPTGLSSVPPPSCQ